MGGLQFLKLLVLYIQRLKRSIIVFDIATTENTKRFKRTLIYFNTDTQFGYCVSVLNKRSFEPFCVWILFLNASIHSVSPDLYGHNRND